MGFCRGKLRISLIAIGVWTTLCASDCFAAEDPIDVEEQQTRLLFGIEEEYRSPWMKRSMLGITAAFVAASPWVSNEFVLPIAYVVTQLIAMDAANSLQKKAYLNELANACSTHLEYRCVRFNYWGKEDVNGNTFQLIRRSTGKVITSIDINVDPQVTEITTTPFTSNELNHEIGKIFQLAIFETAQRAGLRPATLMGEGHLHLDFDSLFWNEKNKAYDFQLFRNFIVDWVNHDELYYGALHYDPKFKGAKPLLSSKSELKRFAEWLSEFDETLASGKMSLNEFGWFRFRLQNHLGFRKGAALSVSGVRIHDKEKQFFKDTIEIRCLRPRQDLNHLKRTVNLIEARVRYLKTLSSPLKFQNSGVIQSIDQGVNRFFHYVTQSKLDWSEMKKLMPKTWQKIVPDTSLSEDELFQPGPRKPPLGQRLCQRILIHVLND